MIPSRPELADDIEDSDDNENDDDDDDVALSPMPVENEETDYTC